ncbi:hypothetical protein FACS1894116_08490 [Betaproteobacteria bacterium]|nr:hypothetical protein FACS1894116_08490 [Betaproteobacteria bacterium]
MLTRCPSCQTVFRLSPEQLNARQGKVRCGHCFNPFNALDYLVAPQDEELPKPTSVRQPAKTGHTPPHVALTVEPTRPPVDLAQAIRDSFATTSAAGKPLPAQHGITPPKARRTLDALDFSSSLDSKPKVPRALTWSSAAELPELNPVTDADSDADIIKALVNEDDAEDKIGDDIDDVIEAIALDADPDEIPLEDKINQIEYEFNNHDARIKIDTDIDTDFDADTEDELAVDSGIDDVVLESLTRQRREVAASDDTLVPKITPERLNAYGKPATRATRMFWGLLVFVLGVALALQSTYLFRHAIAREVPILRPWLVMACAELECDMPLPRDLSLIRISDSDLQSDPGRPGHYVFFATISNQANFVQDWPSLELTLSDGINTPLARRVIPPAEWVTRERIGNGFAPRSDLSVRLVLEVDQLDPSNYHVDRFYP